MIKKLSDYVADFKGVKDKSKIEILFLTIFFLFLFFPMSSINQDEISVQENRTLTEWKPFITQDGKINYNFGKNFDEWFNDRFRCRSYIIHLYYKIFNKHIRYNNIEGITYLNNENNFIFADNIWETDNNWTKPSKNDYKKYLYTYKKLYKYASENGISLYIVAIPTKEKALIKFQDKNIKSYANYTERVEYIQEYLNSYSPKYSIIYPLKSLENKREAYYKTDHHYTDYGALLVSKILFKIMKNDKLYLKQFNNFSYTYDNHPHGTWSNERFNGSLYNRLNLTNEKLFDCKYKYFNIDNTNIKITTDNNIYKKTYFNPEAPNNTKVYLIGDSFSHSIGRCLAYSFKDLIIRRDNFSNHKLYANELLDDINKEKPSILIFVYAAPHIDRFLKTFYTGEI